MSSSCVATTVSEHGSAGRRPQNVEKTYEAILNEGAAPGLPARTALRDMGAMVRVEFMVRVRVM